LQVVAAAKVGMSELPGDRVLGLHLLDEADVLGVGAQDVLERVLASGVGVADQVNGAARTLAQSLQYIIVKEFLRHEAAHLLGSALPNPAGGNREDVSRTSPRPAMTMDE